MEERRKEDRVSELRRRHEEDEKRKAIKERLLALEMKRREGYVSCSDTSCDGPRCNAVSFQKAKVLAQKREREGSNHKAEGAGRGGGGVETPPATEARTDKADREAPLQSSVAKSDEADKRLRKKLEELTFEMRAKFRVLDSATTTVASSAAVTTPTRTDPVTRATPPASGAYGSVESIEERVKRDIEHAQKVIQGGSAPHSSAEVEVNGENAVANANPTSSNARTLVSTNSVASVVDSNTRSHAPSVAAAAATSTTEESPEIPVRDTSSRLTKESDKLKLKVSEVYARHQSDLEAIRNANLGIDLPATRTQHRQREQQRQEQQALLDAFSAKRSGSSASHPAAKAMPPPPPRPVAVPKADAPVVGSGDDSGGGGHRSPHKLHMADPSSEDGAAATADPFNFMATARRTYVEETTMHHRAQIHQQQQHHQHDHHQLQQQQQQLIQEQPQFRASEAPQGNVALSEGPLSTSWISSAGGACEDANQVDGGAVHAAPSNAEAAKSGAVKKDSVGKGKKSKRRGSGSSGREPSHSSRGSANEQKSVSTAYLYKSIVEVIFSVRILLFRLFQRLSSFASWQN